MMRSDMETLPCAEWAEKLAALHPSDLTSTEQDELTAHLASCTGCAQTYRDYHHLARLVRDLAASEALPDLPGLPELPDEQEVTSLRDIPISQPGITSSLPRPLRPRGHRWNISSGALVAGIVVVLLAGVLLGNIALKQHSGSPIVSQGQGPVYTITPQGGPPPSSTPQVNPGGPLILANPTPPFFLDGNVYRNSTVYRADTGARVQQYLKELGAVSVYEPRLVDGTLYMAVRPADLVFGKMVMYALRASDGAVLWKWDNCGESDNMSSPTIANKAVYFMCEAAPSLYWLYALQAKTGTLLWRNTFSGEAALSVLVNQQMLYVPLDNQLLAERTDTGALLWKQSFGGSSNFIDQTMLSNGILYISQGTTFFAEKASDGARMWEYQFVGDYMHLEPVVGQNAVYLYVTQQSGPESIYAVDGTTGTLHWQKQLDVGLNSFVVDHGNLYMSINVYATPRQSYAPPLKRELLAIRGSDGHTLWQQDISWNKGKLSFAMIEPPMVSAGGGRVYLVDWQPQQSSMPRNLKVTMGAFSESDGALLWTRDVS